MKTFDKLHLLISKLNLPGFHLPISGIVFNSHNERIISKDNIQSVRFEFYFNTKYI